MAKTLNTRQRTFAMEYVWGEHCGNGVRCAEIAGYRGSSETLRRQAHDVLKHPAVRALVDAETAERERQIKQKWVHAVDHAFDIATADIGEMFDENGKFLPAHRGSVDEKGAEIRMPQRERRAVASIEQETRYEGRGEDAEEYTVTKIKLHPKQPSIEFLAKLAGKLKDSVVVEGMNLEQLVLAADRMVRERQAKAK